ncbi:hypothetical protein B4U80_10263 [Leptotrombidium deliense]|uniref:Enoyl-CoA hydratase-like protein n=1 Tax=Leptotrombidium deliense TaxID=299467 RepID=A0A443S555_9ACAR|nr:hypothetical protein B4U80_10263 [Leptotrombidium deliense]
MLCNVWRPVSNIIFGVQRRLTSTCVITEKIEEITIISINRPDKRNCVNSETAQLLLKAFEDFEKDDTSKVAILHGKSGNFCAGYDLEEVANEVKNGNNEPLGKSPIGPTYLTPSKSTIAAIDGYAVGGGFELALMCDLRICEENSVMGVFNRRFGIPLINGGTVRLPKIIGLTRAMDLILTGRKVTAKEAFDMGIVNRVTDVGTVLGVAINLALSLTKFPQECLLADRRSVYHSVFEAKSIEEAFNFEGENGVPIVAKEGIEGARKFAESGLGKHGKFNLHSINELLEKNEPKVP